MLEFVADKLSQKPVYRQLADYILEAASKGLLKNGEKLPSERELSEQTGMARATIKKAYELLARDGVVEVHKGSGTYLAAKPAEDKDASGSGLAMVKALITGLQKKGYSLDEITSLFRVSMAERLSQSPRVKVAAIDCNPETLDIIEHQLSSYSSIQFSKYLLDSVMGFKLPEKTLADFDFIFTTTTHFNDLTSAIPNLKEKVIKAVLSPDIETVIGLKSIDKSAKAGLVTRSERFAGIARDFITSFGCGFSLESYVHSGNNDELSDFINSKDVIIIPPVYSLRLENYMSGRIFDFLRSGGKVVIFNYTIEQGSLIYIEEKAQAIANNQSSLKINAR